MTKNFVFVFQEWDILKEEQKDEKKYENVVSTPAKRLCFGSVLQQARIRKRLTTFDVANRVNTSAKVISMIENGTEIPQGQLAKDLHKLLEI
tara:strand:- start:1304 stop:1579 length:276 start_codon:yes stop_codon:yes gene_type:complete